MLAPLGGYLAPQLNLLSRSGLHCFTRTHNSSNNSSRNSHLLCRTRRTIRARTVLLLLLLVYKAYRGMLCSSSSMTAARPTAAAAMVQRQATVHCTTADHCRHGRAASPGMAVAVRALSVLLTAQALMVLRLHMQMG